MRMKHDYQTVIKNIKKAATLTLAAVGLALSAAPGAHAQDTKWYPGSMCTKKFASAPDVQRDFAGVRNRNRTTPVQVICPLIWHSNVITEVSVVVVDQSTVDRVECTFQSHAIDSEGRRTTPNDWQAASGVSESSPRPVRFGPHEPGLKRIAVINPFPNAPSVLLCSIPADRTGIAGEGVSSIEHYILQEE